MSEAVTQIKKVFWKISQKSHEASTMESSFRNVLYGYEFDEIFQITYEHMPMVPYVLSNDSRKMILTDFLYAFQFKFE